MKYFSGIGCDICGRKLFEAVLWENNQIKKVKHKRTNVMLKAESMLPLINFFEFFFPLAMIGKAGHCLKNPTAEDFVNLEKFYAEIGNLRKLLLMCSDEELY